MKNNSPRSGQGEKKQTSIEQTLQSSYIIIITLMLAAPIVSLSFSWYQTLLYDRIITNVSRTNRLNQIVKTDIANELWDIVAGNIEFTEGNQYKIIEEINQRLFEIYQQTEVGSNRQMLEVAGRTVDTLTRYVDRMGLQIQNNFLVEENEIILEEIRGVADLISDILQDFIVLEIEAASSTNEKIKEIAVILTFFQLFILIVVMLFSLYTQRSVIRNINYPIQDLVSLSTEIAEGNLSARARQHNVLELDHLTENLNIMAANIKSLIEANIEEQKNFQKSEMKALQAQITPHFLYNTLDTIVWLAEGRQYDQVISITRSFSDFFRATLNRGREWTSVEDEVAHIRNYLTIQKVRYRDILDYTIEMDQRMEKKTMLKLLLQPLVENALYHGLKNKRGKGKLTVRAWQEENMLCFEVKDTGIGITSERLVDIKKQISTINAAEDEHNDIYGLYNVSKRLFLYYNNQANLDITSQYQEGTCVIFRIPEIEIRI